MVSTDDLEISQQMRWSGSSLQRMSGYQSSPHWLYISDNRTIRTLENAWCLIIAAVFIRESTLAEYNFIIWYIILLSEAVIVKVGVYTSLYSAIVTSCLLPFMAFLLLR